MPKTIKGHWGDLPQQIKQVPSCPKSWTQRDIELFLEVETILYLYELLVPENPSRSALEAWVLISGYMITGVNDQPYQQRACLLLRQRLRYVKTASAWHWWFRWYREQPEPIRLYKVERLAEDTLTFHQQAYSAVLRGERLAAYERLLTAVSIEPPQETKHRWAEAGTYHYSVDGQTFAVNINEAMAKVADTSTPRYPLQARSSREPLAIDLDELLITAQEVDNLEAQLRLSFPGNWHSRLVKLQFASTLPESEPTPQRTIELNGLFHLAGALGVGKSSLIWVLTYHLARKRELHVTVMLNTVVEAIQMAVWLRRLGVAAAPALGNNPADHQRKYGLANAEALRPDRMMKPTAPNDPVLEWMPTPCALSGGADIPIPVGKEPCYRLYDSENKAHTCPLLPVCPVHQVRRDLVESRVWTVNPMSFLYSSAPAGMGDQQMSLLEAVYQRSDVLIIDEADRVQVQWDRAFAPTSAMAGSDDALLDRLHPRISEASVGRYGRRKAAESAFNRLTTTDSQAHLLASRAFRLLRSSPDLQKWTEKLQLTNPALFNQLKADLLKYSAKNLDALALEALDQRLDEAFKSYWRSGLHRESGSLADWLNRLLATDANNPALRQELKRRLAEIMGWKGKFDAARNFLVLKLDLCITLTAMLKRGRDLLYQLKWIEDETGLLQVKDYAVANTLTDLVPASPLGDLLSIRWMRQSNLNDLGVFNLLRCQGVGRWLLLNLPNLYEMRSSAIGPHVLLASATSWLPGAAQFHLAAPPQAVLTFRPEAVTHTTHIDLYFRALHDQGRLLPVSGAGEAKEQHIRQIVRAFASQGNFQDELNYWQDQGMRRRILLVVNSYAQANWVLDELERLDDWKDRAVRLLPDDADEWIKAGIRAREVERFDEDDADILIAPLMAIQRGFNILDQEEAALLGTVYFLVRPYPPPDDLSNQIYSLNTWLLHQLDGHTRVLNEQFSAAGVDALAKLRKRAFGRWNRLVRESGHGIRGMSDTIYAEYLRDSFIVIWQTIGRLLRGNRDARVFFVDGKFGPDGNHDLLRDWQQMLAELTQSPTAADRFLADQLYAAAAQAFDRALKHKEI